MAISNIQFSVASGVLQVIDNSTAPPTVKVSIPMPNPLAELSYQVYTSIFSFSGAAVALPGALTTPPSLVWIRNLSTNSNVGIYSTGSLFATLGPGGFILIYAGTGQSGLAPSLFINSIVRASNVVTVLTPVAHNLNVGQQVLISGVSGTTLSMNGIFTVATVPTTTEFTFDQTGPDESGTGGQESPYVGDFKIDNSGSSVAGSAEVIVGTVASGSN